MFDQFSSESAMDELRQITESVSPKHTFSRLVHGVRLLFTSCTHVNRS